ncbi:MAG: tetratricopeptide repeat protein [Thermoanaerobaculia bacterium]
MTGNLLRFPPPRANVPPEEARAAAERVLATPIPEQRERALQLHLEDPEQLLCLCELLRSRLESSPANVLAEVEFLYDFLEKPRREIGEFDEREYFLGELALTAGTACRVLFHRDEARRWFDRAEANFVLVQNPSAQVARLSYQRLALGMEERRFDEILEFAPIWSENLDRLGLPEDALKCGFLVALALREIGQLKEAIHAYHDLYQKAEALGNARLTAQAANNLAQVYRVMGQNEDALAYARTALPLLQQLDNRVGLAKLRWCVGDILREQGKPGEALEAYRAALQESQEIGLRGDEAALHLVVADLLLQADQEGQAEWEIRAALPIIDEEKMVPEGVAALSLLRESLRRRQIDRQALRNLHGYFQDAQG